MRVLNLLDRGPLDYMEVDALQRDLHHDVADLRAPDTLIAWQSRDVYTAGRRTRPQDVPDAGLAVVEADRGGSVTYHGPGQLVVYPIVRTPEGSDVVAFVRALEGAVIAALAAFSIRGERVGGRSGVWCGGNKICAIGVKFSRNTTLHGLALNVATDLEKFTRIVPCGISNAGVASMESLGRAATLDEAAEALLPELSSALGAFQLRTEGR